MTAPTLYHYTSFEAVASIIESGQIWMTSITDLNDRQEIALASTIAKGIATELAEGLSPSERQATRLYLDQLLSPSLRPYQPVTFSVSTRGDSLCQWIAYCPRGEGGYAIGFEFPGDPPAPCIYKRAKQREHLYEYVVRWFHWILERVRRGTSMTEVREAVMFEQREFAKLAAQIKHPAFKHEREHRLFREGTPPNVRQRSNGKRTIDYLPVPCPVIGEIVVGPSPDPSSSMDRMRDFLAGTDLDVPLRSSAIPYRWE